MSLYSVKWLFISLALVLNCIANAESGRHFCKKQKGRDSCSEDDAHLSTPEECNRECQVGEPPKTCYYHFTAEFYTVMGGACQLCTPNVTVAASNDCQCVLADGIDRTILTVNRMMPGPSIQVCRGDKVVIDLENHMSGLELTIHWHGILQKGSQYYDGVPFLTQCPVQYGKSFRYQWEADNEGTHFWHAHTGMHKMDGIYGSIIVRTPRKEDPNSHLYQYDLPHHVIVMADWMHELTSEHFPGLLRRKPLQRPDSLLINGRGRYKDPVTGTKTNVSLETFHVKAGFSYRFRVINAFCTTCPAELKFQGHTPTLIAMDGVPIKPIKINSINSGAGERFDLVITADQPVGSYWIHLRGLGACSTGEIEQLAILRYEDGPHKPNSAHPTYNSPLPQGILIGPMDGMCNNTRDNAVCISQLKSARPVDRKLIRARPDYTFYFGIEFFTYVADQLFKPGTYEPFSIPGGSIANRALVNNISFVFPPVPPLSQYNDIPPGTFCDKNHIPEDCGTPCACTQVYNISMNTIVEFVLTDGFGVQNIFHPVHIHGYAVNVIGMGKSPYKNIKKMTPYHARYLDKKNKLGRNFHRPPYKDTIAIPTGGYVIVRFRANNPGFWLMHCHFLFHQMTGMEMIFRVGEIHDLPPVPPKFPVCGDYLPKITSKKYTY